MKWRLKMRTFNFVKEESDRWFIVLPEWTGLKEDLEMVSGADLMLDKIAGDEKSIDLILSEESFEDADVLVFEKFGPSEYESGAYYQLDNYLGEKIDIIIWLCPVTLFVFKDGYPDYIYFKKV
jgi:hypothetical protein